MAVTAYVYNQFKKDQFNGSDTDFDATSKLKVALFTDTYTPALTDLLYSSLSGEVANGNGYTTGGATISGAAFSGTTTVAIDATDVAWTFTGSKTARYAVVYNATSSSLISYIDFGSDQTSAATFTLQWNASGLYNISSS